MDKNTDAPAPCRSHQRPDPAHIALVRPAGVGLQRTAIAQRLDQRRLGRPLPRRGSADRNLQCQLVLFLILGTVFGIGMAATILVAQSVGARDLAEARRIVGTSATFFFLISMLFAVCGWIWVDAILNTLGTPADALPLARSYLRIIFVAVPMMNLLSFVMTVLRGAGDSRTPFSSWRWPSCSTSS